MSVYGLHSQQFPSFWFTYSAVLYVQDFPVFGLPIQQFCMSRGIKKKKFPSRTRVFETRVLWKIEGKIFSPVELESLKLEFYWVKFFPSMLCLGREPTKTEHWGNKISPVELESLKLEFYWGTFFPSMLCLGREPTKTEHLGEKISQYFNFFFPKCSV